MQINRLISIRYESPSKDISEKAVITRLLPSRCPNIMMMMMMIIIIIIKIIIIIIIIIVTKWKITSYFFFIVLLSPILNYVISHSTDCHFLKVFCFLMRILVSYILLSVIHVLYIFH